MRAELELDKDNPQYGAAKEKRAVASELVNPDTVGEFEQDSLAYGQAVRPLTVSAGVRDYLGTIDYEAGYNMYVTPLRATLRAMGRLKDLESSGAPLTPDAVDKRTASAFRELKFDSNDKKNDDASARGQYNAWSNDQRHLQIAVADTHAAQHGLWAAMRHCQKTQLMLERRAKQADISNTKASLADIERHAKTLADIVRVSNKTLSTLSAIDAMVSSSLDVSDTSDAALYTGSLSGDDHARAGSTRTRQQRVGEGLEVSQEVVHQIHGMLMQPQNRVRLEDVMIVVMGDAGTYMDLQKQLDALAAELAELELDIENEEIAQASSAYRAAKGQLATRQLTVDTQRIASRRDAQNFANSLGAGTNGVLAMLSAEAYQEAELFGNQANAQRRELAPKARWIERMLVQHKLTFEAQHWQQDWMVLGANVVGVRAQGKAFHRLLPEWEERASAWRAFLKQRTKNDLVR